MLLNLTKIRYMDAPVFLEVGSIINQYELEGTVSLGASWFGSPASNSQSVGGTGRYADRPTITYSPLMGEKFARSLMTPIPVPAILFMIQAGYPIDFVFRIAVQTINGIENSFGGQLMEKAADQRFFELLRLLKQIQNSNKLGMRIKPLNDEKDSIVMFFRPETDAGDQTNSIAVRRILGLDLETDEFLVSYGAIAKNNREIAILTRSLFQVMIELASYIEAPATDVSEGRVFASKKENPPDFPDLVRIHSGSEHSAEAFVSVKYRDHWFWIDDRDVASKRMFSFIMLLFSLTETGDQGGAPIVTVPTN